MLINHGKQTLESMNQAVWYNRWTLEKIAPFLKGNILEVGCGIGNFTKYLATFGKVLAIDIENDYLKQTRKNVGTLARVAFGDIEKGKYSFKDNNFDTIVCLNVLEHIQKDEQALNNLYKLLKKDGVLILLIPAHPILFGNIDKMIGHFRRYTKRDALERVKQANFSLVSCRRLNFLGALGWFLSGRIFGNTIVSESKIKLFNIVAPFVLSLETVIEPPLGTSILVIAKKI